MTLIRDQVFDEERALYGSRGVELVNCRFDGPADGESALKECRDVKVQDCFFNLRYPFWHVTNLEIDGSELTPPLPRRPVVHGERQHPQYEAARHQGPARVRGGEAGGL